VLKRAVIVCVGLLIWGAMGHAQQGEACGGNAELRVSAGEARQGSLLTVEVKSAKGIAEVKGEWDGREVAFWEDATDEVTGRKGGAAGRRAELRALIGVDLEKAAGNYELKVSGKMADGTALSCTAFVDVKPGRFATEKLHVGKQFVEPSPEQLQRAKEETARLRAIFAGVTPEKLWNGRFRVPLDGVTTGGNFGRRRVLNGQPGSPHSGVDFPAAAGTPVHASQSGRVVLAEELFFSGNTVVLDHGLGIYTLYGHLSSVDVKAGDDVAAGTVLGNVGATGRATGPHLHWGLTVERARVNALEIVRLLQ
jgi:murein DD-endopeptidase MepM/ murein hydrolase activator NlpD